MSAYLSQRFFLTAGDRPEVSQPTSNCQILLLYSRSTFAARRCDSIILGIRLYMMLVGSRSPIYFNLSNCRGEPNFRDRIRPLFSHRFLEFASWKTDGCWRCVGNILLKKAIRALGQNAGRAIGNI
ncbi:MULTISPECIES: hypothetical protein [unclassified Microcoleus]|uniref:hypothetical protein n=1 Tax=unclassified Microcoleus TaxID=2642155 RepID=UPI002FD4A595